MKGRVVLVTGGTGGIGLSVAQAFSAAGARLAVTRSGSRPAKPGLDRSSGAFVVSGDADSDGERVVSAVVRKLGRLDVLVNAAGLSALPSRTRTLEDITDKEWEEAMGTCLWGPFVCSRAAARVMKQGAIVNVTRVGALTGLAPGLPEIAAGAGLLGLTRGLAAALAPRIRVNCMALGPIGPDRDRTDAPGTRRAGRKAIPVGRLGTPQDVGSLALFLAENPFVTGQTVVLDGGVARV